MVTVLSENRDYVWIDKPAGVAVHNNPAGQDSLLQRLGQQGWPGLLPVHRLDLEASGVLLLAKSAEAARIAGLNFEERQVEKVYVCLLRGVLKGPTVWDWPLVDAAQGYRDPQGPLAERKEARTEVRVLDQSNYFTLVEIRLETGRTHQIRRHAALAGHQILGDFRYTRPGYPEKIRELYGLRRLMLHSRRLQIPTLDVQVEAPIPSIFQEILERSKCRPLFS